MKVFARSDLVYNGRRVGVRFAEVEGRLVCIGLEIGPQMVDPPDKGETFINVRPDDLRPLAAVEMRMPLRRMIDMALEAAVMVRAGTGDPEADHRAFASDLEVLRASQAEPRKRPGRPPLYGRQHYEEVARIYREHLQAGGRAPTKAVADHFAVTKATAAKWVARARHEFDLIETNDGE